MHRRIKPNKCKGLAEMDEVRCSNCRRLLARGHYSNIEIKCPRCGAINRFFYNPKATSLQSARHRASSEKEVSHGNSNNSD